MASTAETKVKSYLRDQCKAWCETTKADIMLEDASVWYAKKYIILLPNPVSQMGGVPGRFDYTAKVVCADFVGRQVTYSVDVEVKPDLKYLSSNQIMYANLHSHVSRLAVVRGKVGVDKFIANLDNPAVLRAETGLALYNIKPSKNLSSTLSITEY